LTDAPFVASNRTTSLSLLAAVATVAVAWFLEPDEALLRTRRTRRSRVVKASLAGVDGFVPAAAATRMADEDHGGTGLGESGEPAAPPVVAATVDDAITGVVLDHERIPVPGATVLLAHREACSADELYRDLGHALRPDDFREPPCTATIRVATSDERGEFRFEAPDRVHGGWLAAGERERGISRLTFVPARADAEEELPAHRELVLGPALAVRGRVLDVDGGSVRSSAGCIVHLDGNFSSNGFDTEIAVREDATFDTPLFPTSYFLLHARSRDFEWTSDPILVRAEDGPVQEVTLRLVAPAPIRLEGRLLGSDGRPLTFDHPYLAGLTTWELRCERDAYSDRSFTVRLTDAETTEIGTTWDEIDANCRCCGWADVDLEDGRWSITLDPRAVWPSRVALVVRDRVVAVAPVAALPDLGAPHDASCRTLAGPDLRVAADAPTRPCEIELRIRVLDAATHAWFADPHLLIHADYFVGGQQGYAYADARDRASLTRTTSVPFTARHCRVVVECPGFMPGALDLEVQRRAEPYELTIPLERAVRLIRVVVVDGAGHPVLGATARLFDEDGERWRRAEVGPATTWKDGRIDFADVGASRKRLAIEAPGFAATCVDLPEGAADLERTVVLTPGVTVRFTGPPDDVHAPMNAGLRVVAADERVVLLDAFLDQQWGFRVDSWPRPLTLAPGAYEWSIEFVDGTGDAGAFVAAEGTEIVVTPRER
jgi:hypothetical protein